MTPALQLPFELISGIFIACLPLNRRVRPHRNRAPLNLASICRQWRAVALATPQLWTSVYLNFCGRDAYDGIPILFGQTLSEPLEDLTASLIDLWFTRAAGHPLSISLICAKDHSLPDQVLTILARYFSQWGRIELGISMADFLVFNEVVGPFPALESVSLHITNRFDPLYGVRVNSVRNSPHLKALQCTDQRLSPIRFKDLGDIPRTVTALRMSNKWSTSSTIAHAHFASLLDHRPHLLHLEFSSSRRLDARSPIRLNACLETLLLDDEHILDSFTIPALKNLGVWLRDSAPVVAFLSHSQCRLTSLTLGLYEETFHTTVASCLLALPELDTLQLILADELRQPGSFDGGLWCQMLRRAELVPQLRTLSISGKARIPPYAEWAALLLMRRAVLVHAELHMRHRHAHVRRRTPPPPTHIEAQLEALAEGGMTVRVMTPNYVWPWDAEDADPVGDLDIDPFGSRIMRTHLFSPF
ncbi:hypothetical protein DFH08DRAFT_781251 [Mycena albidolilacea]|uniref:F-box domain-containing protein n=1 Tax=Mycena albidolilacea TaxID=1033008 RepID=A0AAD7EP90_9AGAR|nr:hypothetical protein DFH08DRAFT_781251 [Mycena albidolilacea]